MIKTLLLSSFFLVIVEAITAQTKAETINWLQDKFSKYFYADNLVMYSFWIHNDTLYLDKTYLKYHEEVGKESYYIPVKDIKKLEFKNDSAVIGMWKYSYAKVEFHTWNRSITMYNHNSNKRQMFSDVEFRTKRELIVDSMAVRIDNAFRHYVKILNGNMLAEVF